MLLGRIMLMQLSVNCRIRHCGLLLSSVVGGDAWITCAWSATWLDTTTLPHE